MATSVNYKRKIWSESIFHKNDFESVHFSNKHDKSYVWSKNLKKKKKKNEFFKNFGLKKNNKKKKIFFFFFLILVQSFILFN